MPAVSYRNLIEYVTLRSTEIQLRAYFGQTFLIWISSNKTEDQQKAMVRQRRAVSIHYNDSFFHALRFKPPLRASLLVLSKSKNALRFSTPIASYIGIS